MAQTVDRACEKYEVKLRLGRFPQRGGITAEEQVARFRLGREHDHDLTLRSSEVLGRFDVQSILWVGYFAPVRKLDRYARMGITGLSLALEAGLLVDYWTGRGLRREVLMALCREVLEIEPESGGWTELGKSLQ